MNGLCPRHGRGRDCAPVALDWALLGGPSTSPLEDVMLRIASPGAVPYHARPGSSGFAMEVSHATQERTPRRPVLSRSPVRDGRGSPRRRESNGEHAWSAASRSSAKSSVATTHARAYQAVDFKNCCMLSGQFDGSDRHHFFQRVRPSRASSNNRWRGP